MSNNKDFDKKDIKLIKKIARNLFLGYNTLTKTVRDRTVYCRKKKHPKKQE